MGVQRGRLPPTDKEPDHIPLRGARIHRLPEGKLLGYICIHLNNTAGLYTTRLKILITKKQAQYTTSGAAYTHKCYCWDESARASGGDPMTSETMCDSACGLGECAMKQKCAASLPPAYVPPKELIPDPVVAELRRASEVRTTQVRSKQHGNA